MAERSTVAKLPDPARARVDELLRLFKAGRLSLDQVMESLDAEWGAAPGVELPSRSAVHRYAQKFDRLTERAARTKAITDQLLSTVGADVADGQGVRAIAQVMQSIVFDILANVDDDTPMDPEQLHFVARAVKDVTSALKTDADRELKVRAETLKTAASAVEKAAKAQGLSKETVGFITKAVLGAAA